MAFTTRVALLKDSKLLGMEIIAGDDETVILFAPELVLGDRLRLGSEARGITRLGNQIDCDLEMRQTLLGAESKGQTITYRVQPDGSAPYRVTLTAAQERAVELIDFHGRPAFKARGRDFFNVEIDADGEVPPADLAGLASAEAYFTEQARRWAAFWIASQVNLPTSEALWQEALPRQPVLRCPKRR